ncbi:MAG TPA: hypothetical protein PKI60_02805 [Oscillospiraceae bacterium]|nr:hypothetical protein [Oscillospiraceae bacterium]
MNKKKLAAIFTVMFAASLLLCIGFRVISDTMKINYQEVQVMVLSASQSVGRKTRHTDVKVYYNGEEYKLNGVSEIWQYSIYQSTGEHITAYMSNGKLYEDVSDIRGDSAAAIVYFIFMGVSIVLLVPMLTFWIEHKKEKKNQPKEEL